MEIKGFQINRPRVQTQNSLSQLLSSDRKEGGIGDAGKVQQDTLTVNGPSSNLSDSQFINVVKKHLLAEVNQGTPEYKLNDLRDQISLGKYDINTAEIARRMMLESEM